MKIIQKLIISIIFLLSIMMLYGLTSNNTYAWVSAGKAGQWGNLDLYDIDVGDWWYDSTTDMKYGTPYKNDETGINVNAWRGSANGHYYWGFDLDTLVAYQNVYCAQKGKLIECPVLWTTIAWRADIYGNTATFYDEYGNVIKTVTNSYNNIMAYITSVLGPKTGWTHQSQDSFSGSQHEFWAWFNKWVEACGYSSYKSPKTSTSSGDRMGSYNANRTYTTRLYYMKVRFGENNNSILKTGFGPQGTEWPDGQSVVVAHYWEDIEPATINVSVKKVWNDDNNAYRNRPGSITVELYKGSSSTGKTLNLSGSGNTWSGTFTDLAPGSDYWVKEISVPAGYDGTYSGTTVTNTLKRTSVKITKTWDDETDRDGKRTPIQIRLLCSDGTSTTATLSGSNDSNTWTYTFQNLPQYKNGNRVTYSVQEVGIPEYTTSISGNGSTNVTITNKHVPERINVTVNKIWEDKDDLDEYRPSSITVTLYADGISTEQTITLNEGNNWTASFTNLYRYRNHGTVIKYTVKENSINEYTVSGDQFANSKTDSKGNVSYTLTNTHQPKYDGYYEITGTAWLDGEGGKQNEIDGVYRSGTQDQLLQGIKVRLKDANGNLISSSYYSGTGNNIKYVSSQYAETAEDGTYTIRVNYDNSQNVYKLYEDVAAVAQKLQGAYVEFEYDGMLYTTVAKAVNSTSEEITSKAIENEGERTTFDNDHSTVNLNTEHPDNWTNKYITAKVDNIISYYNNTKDETREVVLKYCNGNGTYIRTNPDGAWKNILSGTRNLACNSGQGHSIRTYNITVQKIPEVNLGLFKREQPDVAIFSDLTKVQVTMNEKSYTYLYGVRSSKYSDDETNLQAQFQTKGTYTYRRPVNPADISYIQEETDTNIMSVLVTYEIKVANLSSTLKTTISEITNYFDKEYTLTNTANWQTISNSSEKGFNQTRYTRAIELEPQKQETIGVTYSVSWDAIKGLLSKDATLNNAVEITEFSTQYGTSTLYAEQGHGGRTGRAYGGYDYNSHPGNANIQLKTGEDEIERLYSTDVNGNIIPVSNLEDDTDLAPSFVLCLDAPTEIAGVVWEDSDTNSSDDERLGNGIREEAENKVQNVKIELYEVQDNGTIGNEPATLYNVNRDSAETDNKSAVLYSGENGEYQIAGLVTGKEYIIKYTYGNNETELGGNVTTIGEDNKVNARNYKSTIITDPIIANIIEKTTLTDDEKLWPINHSNGYSVAVDNMEDRLSISALTNKTYTQAVNMTAYTKPFIIPVEFTIANSGEVRKDDEDVVEGIAIDESGNALPIVLNKFDFGIIERPRENLIVQKTITDFKITLSNGQFLTQGNPSDPNANISYVKAIGFRESTTVAEAVSAVQKMLLVEMDAELMQGAQIEVTYAVKVINNNELDYDYAVNPKYYYYGDKTGLDGLELASEIKYVDYLDTDIVYKEDTTTWTETDAETLEVNGYINEDVETELKKGGYRILQTEGGNAIRIERGGESETVYMQASKLLVSTDENVYDNHAEIIEIDGKTARTVKGFDETTGKQLEYVPGNYIPASGPNESDDDSVNITITPPTGATNYITTYVISGLVGLVVLLIGIMFIKKKVISR